MDAVYCLLIIYFTIGIAFAFTCTLFGRDRYIYPSTAWFTTFMKKVFTWPVYVYRFIFVMLFMP